MPGGSLIYSSVPQDLGELRESPAGGSGTGLYTSQSPQVGPFPDSLGSRAKVEWKAYDRGRGKVRLGALTLPPLTLDLTRESGQPAFLPGGASQQCPSPKGHRKEQCVCIVTCVHTCIYSICVYNVLCVFVCICV